MTTLAAGKQETGSVYQAVDYAAWGCWVIRFSKANKTQSDLEYKMELVQVI